MIMLYILQLEEQKFEMDKLRRDLEEKIGEIQAIKGILQSSEKVCMSVCVYLEKLSGIMYLSVFLFVFLIVCS